MTRFYLSRDHSILRPIIPGACHMAWCGMAWYGHTIPDFARPSSMAFSVPDAHSIATINCIPQWCCLRSG